MRIRFVQNGAAWSMDKDEALEFALASMNGKWTLDWYPFAKRLKTRGQMHEAHDCHALNCYHALDWEREDWADLAKLLREQGARTVPLRSAR